jgi:putative flippase GtrA
MKAAERPGALRQLFAYASVGVLATLAHYLLLVGLVEAAYWPPVPATLAGYVVGGVVAYALNRRHTFSSTRAHAEAGWRFAVAAFAGFCATFALMSLFVEVWRAPYLPAQIVTSILAMFMTFAINRAWTFRT